MEYFVGSVVTVATIILVGRYLRKIKTVNPKSIRYSQSRTFELMGDLMTLIIQSSKPKRSQSLLHKQREETRIAFIDNQAYWIRDNCFYTAPVINNEIDVDAAVQVDTMSMDAVQLNKMLYIVEQLREGLEDDSWNPGK